MKKKRIIKTIFILSILILFITESVMTYNRIRCKKNFQCCCVTKKLNKNNAHFIYNFNNPIIHLEINKNISVLPVVIKNIESQLFCDCKISAKQKNNEKVNIFYNEHSYEIYINFDSYNDYNNNLQNLNNYYSNNELGNNNLNIINTIRLIC